MTCTGWSEINAAKLSDAKSNCAVIYPSIRRKGGKGGTSLSSSFPSSMLLHSLLLALLT